jgi:subtilisin family serine protease
VTADFTEQRTKAERNMAQLAQISTMYDGAKQVLQGAMGGTALTPESVKALVPANETVRAAQDLWLRFSSNGITEQEIVEGVEQVRGQAQYGLNPALDARSVVGDDPRNPAQTRYGNRDVTGPDASHGSHVAGIIGAARGAEGIDGIASAVQLLAVRAVPRGDERDKDVALAIRYAVDHGAHIINMSFGKGYSPEKSLVDDAVRYADAKGVLLVHAAGNDGQNLATGENFPKAQYLGGGEAANWIEVGASSWRGGNELAASFSNYGRQQVDLFAPGVDITSTVPGGGYKANSGTSMAAPVVSGVAALLMSYFPKLTAAEVKRILLETSAKYPELMVARPGATPEELVRFGELSRTGGVVDAYAAVQAALAMGAKAR